MAGERQRRHRSPLFALLLAVLATLTVVGTTPASAQEDSEIVVDGSRATVTVVAAGPITSGEGAPGALPYWPYTCHWDQVFANSDVILGPSNGPIPGHRYFLRCLPDDGSGLDPIGEFVVYDPLDPVPGFAAVTSIEIRDFARDFVQPNPLLVGVSPDGVQITGVETWFWPDGSIAAVQASANANGLTVTVEARYRGTSFDLGVADLDLLVCTEQQVWVGGSENTDCAHTYLNQAEQVTIGATSEWDFVWWDNAAQAVPALFETIFPVEALDIEIIDLEAVITKSR